MRVHPLYQPNVEDLSVEAKLRRVKRHQKKRHLNHAITELAMALNQLSFEHEGPNSKREQDVREIIRLAGGLV